MGWYFTVRLGWGDRWSQQQMCAIRATSPLSLAAQEPSHQPALPNTEGMPGVHWKSHSLSIGHVYLTAPHPASISVCPELSSVLPPLHSYHGSLPRALGLTAPHRWHAALA